MKKLDAWGEFAFGVALEILKEFPISEDEIPLFCVNMVQKIEFRIGAMDFSCTSFAAACFPGSGLNGNRCVGTESVHPFPRTRCKSHESQAGGRPSGQQTNPVIEIGDTCYFRLSPDSLQPSVQVRRKLFLVLSPKLLYFGLPT